MTALRFDGRVALVTGAAGGLGRAMAIGLARRGARILLNAPYSTTKSGLLGLTLDAAIEGGPHGILVNAIMPTAFSRLIEQIPDPGFVDWFRRHFPAQKAADAALYLLSDTSTSTGLIWAVGGGRAARVTYAEGQAAVDWGRYQIATNLLLPLADTNEFRTYHRSKPNVLDLMTSQLPIPRLGDPVEDIGGAAVFLAGDAVNFINGETVHADGGQHIAGPVLNPARFK